MVISVKAVSLAAVCLTVLPMGCSSNDSSSTALPSRPVVAGYQGSLKPETWLTRQSEISGFSLVKSRPHELIGRAASWRVELEGWQDNPEWIERLRACTGTAYMEGGVGVAGTALFAVKFLQGDWFVTEIFYRAGTGGFIFFRGAGSVRIGEDFGLLLQEAYGFETSYGTTTHGR